MQINIIGPLLGISGYDNHTRCFVREMRKQGVRLRATHYPNWSAPVFSHHEMADIFDHPDQKLNSFDITLHFLMPHLAEPSSNTLNVCYTMFEADAISESFLQYSLSHHKIVVPTHSSAQAWIDSGFPTDRLRICPLGVDASRFTNDVTDVTASSFFTNDVRYRFLNIADLRPRKNHLGLLRAWLKATRAGDDAHLLLKMNPLEPLVTRQLNEDIRNLENSVGKSFREAAPMSCIFACLSETDVVSLYKSATHYISLSHGEGWDLPMTEAMASGLHVIAPYHSAYESYLSENIATLIPATKMPAASEGSYRTVDNIWFENLNWWQPDEARAIDIIQQIIDGSLAPIHTAQEYIKNNMSWSHATTQLIAILAEM